MKRFASFPLSRVAAHNGIQRCHRWLTRRVEFPEGLLGACRYQPVRSSVAALALTGLLLSQTLVPCGMLLSSVQAAEQGRTRNNSKIQAAPIPAWARTIEKRALQQERARRLRLTQLKRAGQANKPVPNAASADLDCLDCEVSIAPLDLSEVPTEQALRRAGGTEGALYPMRRADPAELGLKLDRLLKKVGVENGLRGQLLPKTRALSA